MENTEKLEIGYGLGKGEDSFATGFEAARQALAGIRTAAPSLVTVFASVRYDLPELLRGVADALGEDVPIVGATTAGEICNGPQQGSAVVTILASPYLEVRVGLGEKVSQGWQEAVAQVVGTPELAPFFSPDDNTAWSELTLQGKSALALLFTPGEVSANDVRSFEILEELTRLSQGRLPIIGGCADGSQLCLLGPRRLCRQRFIGPVPDAITLWGRHGTWAAGYRTADYGNPLPRS